VIRRRKRKAGLSLSVLVKEAAELSEVLPKEAEEHEKMRLAKAFEDS